ncbi:hypothetical protein Tco_0576169, partial [Tanacetum coccineum]
MTTSSTSSLLPANSPTTNLPPATTTNLPPVTSATTNLPLATSTTSHLLLATSTTTHLPPATCSTSHLLLLTSTVVRSLRKDEEQLKQFVEKLENIKKEIQVKNHPSQKTGDVIEDIYAIKKPKQNL